MPIAFARPKKKDDDLPVTPPPRESTGGAPPRGRPAVPVIALRPQQGQPTGNPGAPRPGGPLPGQPEQGFPAAPPDPAAFGQNPPAQPQPGQPQSLAESPATPGELAAAGQSLEASPQMQNVRAMEANQQAMAGAVPSPGDFARQDTRGIVDRSAAMAQFTQAQAAGRPALAPGQVGTAAQGVSGIQGGGGFRIQGGQLGGGGVPRPPLVAPASPAAPAAGLGPQMDPAAAQARLGDSSARVATDPASVSGYRKQALAAQAQQAAGGPQIQVGPDKFVSQRDFIRTSNIMGADDRLEADQARRRQGDLKSAANALFRQGDTAGARELALAAMGQQRPPSAQEQARQVLSGEREMQLANQAFAGDPRIFQSTEATRRQQMADEARRERQDRGADIGAEADTRKFGHQKQMEEFKQGFQAKQAQEDRQFKSATQEVQTRAAPVVSELKALRTQFAETQGQTIGDPERREASLDRLRTQIEEAEGRLNKALKAGGGGVAGSAGTAPGSAGAAAGAGASKENPVQVATEADALQQPPGTYVILNGRLFQTK